MATTRTCRIKSSIGNYQQVFCSTGLKEFELPRDFHELGAHACDNCKLLTQVDISNTSSAEIREFTFVHCVRLRDVRLPYTVHTIHVKAFMNCAALQGLAIPPSLHYRQQGVPRL